MILYHAISSYQLIEVVLHKLIYNNEETSILMISKDVTRRLPQYEKFNQYFADIIIYDNGIGNYSILKGNGLHEYFNNFFRHSKYNLNSFEKIYLACAHHSFGIYLCETNHHFIMFEDGAGAISRPEILELVEKKFVNKNELAKKYGLYNGLGNLIDYCIYNAKFQESGFQSSEKWVNFDVAEILNSLDFKVRDNLTHIFTQMDKINVPQKSALILTEHFANLRIFSWEKQIVLYQLLADYFLQDYHLIFKPHPDDLMYYSELFPNSDIIKDKFPAEILPYMFNTTPDLVATISSTAIYGLQQCFKEKLQFNYEFSHKKKQFLHLNKYYSILNHIALNQIKKIYILGVNNVIINNLCKFNKFAFDNIVYIDDLNCNIEDNSAIIIDESPLPVAEYSQTICSFLDDLSEFVYVYFVNSNNDYCFYNYDYKYIWKNIYPIEIRKTKTREKDLYIDLNTEYVYLYIKGMKNIMKNTFEKELIYSGVTVSTIIEDDKDLKIKMLQGMLAATEKRLLYYIEKSSKNNTNGKDNFKE